MSAIANIILGFAKNIANMRNSFLAVRIKEKDVSFSFVSKNSEKLYWEDHYPNIAFYFGESAVPFRFTVDKEIVQKADENETIELLDNAISTKKYKTFMQNESTERMFNVKGASQDIMIKLLYLVAGLAGMNLIVLLAMYGG